jgi:hypothetical protein
MATVVGETGARGARVARVDGADVDGAAEVVVPVVEECNGSDVEVDAVAIAVAEDPDRVAAQIPPAAPSTTTRITTNGAGPFHQGRFRRCLPRMATTLAEPAGPPADGGCPTLFSATECAGWAGGVGYRWAGPGTSGSVRAQHLS